MKASSGPPRTPSRLSDSAHHQLSMYALAASAAGVAMLALAQPTEAKVIYTPAHKWLPLNRNFYLDLNHDGVSDFLLFMRDASTYTCCFTHSLWVSPQAENGAIGHACPTCRNHSVIASALPKGAKVGPGSPFLRRNALMFCSGNTDAGSFHSGSWLYLGKPAYLGLEFKIKGRTHYGWARMANVQGEAPKAELTGYAYETIPNKPIIAGKTKGPDVITVNADSLGRLARGASTSPTAPAKEGK
jgi:hypothetical protein